MAVLKLPVMADRLYYADSFLTTFDAAVTDIREVSRSGGQSVWKMAFDRTAFYPASGGQPFDTGLVSATSRNGAVLEIPIDEVDEDESGEVWHYTTKPLIAGTKVHAELAWHRRFDHMQQHSGQHLLSAVFLRELHAKTVSFHLGDESSTVDLASDSIAHSSLERIERLANQIVAEDRPVTTRTVGREEAQALLANGQLRKLPERDGNIRLIEIASLDLNACGGTHVRSTGQIGGIHLRSTERVRQGLRVEFVCGIRAAALTRRDFETLTAAATALSVARRDLPEAVERVLVENKAAAKERLALREQLAELHAIHLHAQAPLVHGLRVIRHEFADRDPEYLKLLAGRISSSATQTLALLASTQREPASVVISRTGDLDFSCGAVLKEILADLGLRGGGSPSLAQGQVFLPDLKALFARIEREARASLKAEKAAAS